MSFLPWTVQHIFAGLWPLVWHWGVPVAVIILSLAGEVVLAWFGTAVPWVGPAMVRPLQTGLLCTAVGAGLFLWGLNDGIKVEHAHSVADQAVLMKQVNSVVDDVLTDPKNQPQPLVKPKSGEKVIPRKSPSDPWDNPEN